MSTGGFVEFTSHRDGEIIWVTADIRNRDDLRKLKVIVNSIEEIYYPAAPPQSPVSENGK